jgi:hypothetical protein
MQIVKIEKIKITGGEIPITLYLDEDQDGKYYTISIDGVEWVTVESQMHAVVLFNMMKDHITEYMHYEMA